MSDKPTVKYTVSAYNRYAYIIQQDGHNFRETFIELRRGDDCEVATFKKLAEEICAFLNNRVDIRRVAGALNS